MTSVTVKRIFVIGDIQGCLKPLQALLEKIHYQSETTTLWFAGDLVNRGPQSLETLRFIQQLPSDTIAVLGNHDLSLLVQAQKPLPDPHHPLYAILTAPDRDLLLDWLRHLPLLHHDPVHQFTLTHAGVYPFWSLSKAIQYAKEVEAALRQENYVYVLNGMFGNTPTHWDDNLQGIDRLRFIFNAFTRMRFCTKEGALDLEAKGTPEQHLDLIPWFKIPHRVMQNENLLFGHWSALEANKKNQTPHIFPLDSGCVWGNALTAYSLNTQEYIHIPCKPYLS